jgi:hypothetical protein
MANALHSDRPDPFPPNGPRRAPATPEKEAAGRPQFEAVLASSAVNMKRGLVAVDVIDRDIDGVVVVTRLGAAIEGWIAVEGQEWTALQGKERIRISVRPPIFGIAAAGGVTGAPTMAVRPDGSFGFPLVSQFEDYRLSITDLPEDVYVKTARFGSRDILGKSFPISGPSSDRVEVLLSVKGGRIEGNASPNATVLLVPQAQLERPDLFRTATADASGRFNLRGIAPGAYTLFAFERTTDSYLALERAGTAVQVTESSRARVDVPFNR